MIKAKSKKCPRCGYALPKKEILRCPRCNASIVERCVDCPGCGASLWGGREECKKEEK